MCCREPRRRTQWDEDEVEDLEDEPDFDADELGLDPEEEEEDDGER